MGNGISRRCGRYWKSCCHSRRSSMTMR
jgi:hypothetical protein